MEAATTRTRSAVRATQWSGSRWDSTAKHRRRRKPAPPPSATTRFRTSASIASSRISTPSRPGVTPSATVSCRICPAPMSRRRAAPAALTWAPPGLLTSRRRTHVYHVSAHRSRNPLLGSYDCIRVSSEPNIANRNQHRLIIKMSSIQSSTFSKKGHRGWGRQTIVALYATCHG